MYQKSGTVYALIALLVLQQSGISHANWFTNLFTSSKSKEAKEAHAEVYGGENAGQPPKNKGSWTHELIAAAAGFEAMRAYERHQAKQQGAPVNHSIMKGVLAGLAAAAVDHLIETKGLDFIDAQRAKSKASNTAEHVAAERYGLTNAPEETSDQNQRNEYRGGNRNAEMEDAEGYSVQATTSAGEYRK